MDYPSSFLTPSIWLTGATNACGAITSIMFRRNAVRVTGSITRTAPQWQNHVPERLPMPRTKTFMESVIQHLRIGNGCWEWGGTKDGLGYGVLNSEKRRAFAHRIVYELVSGEILPGLEIDHLCHNRACVRPDHLEAVTHAENMRRSAVYKQWTHCAKGHALRGENLTRSSGGRFRCKECKRQSDSHRWKRKGQPCPKKA